MVHCLPVEINVDAFTAARINQDIFRMAISQADYMPHSRPNSSGQSEVCPRFVPSMRRCEVLDEPPIHQGTVLFQYQLVKLLRCQLKVVLLEVYILTLYEGIPQLMITW